MAGVSGSLDYWRKFFRTTGSDIIDVIEFAILVASSDCPKELRSRRDQITEKLYACRMPGCYGCEREQQMGGGDEVEEGGGSIRKESKVGSSSSGRTEESNPVVSNYSYNEAEALTEEIEEENQTVGEVLRIKEILVNHQDESDNVLFDSLRRLQLMDLSVETLKATDIGRAVNVLRKHSVKHIRQLVRTLIEDWKTLVDQWVSATAALAESSPASMDPQDVEEEEGLPSPPLDEGAFLPLGTQTTSIQLSEFFDGMDDDGNFRINDELDENQQRDSEIFEMVGKRQMPEETWQLRRQEEVIRKAPNVQSRPQSIDRVDTRRQDSSVRQTKPQGTEREDMRRQEPEFRQTKPRDAPNGQPMLPVIGDKQRKNTTADSGPGRPPKLPSEKKNGSEFNSGFQKKSQFSSQEKQAKLNITNSGPGRPPKISSEIKAGAVLNAGGQRNQPYSLQEKLKNSEDNSLRAKLEAAKRKLQENYQQAENAKKQRTIQVMELHDIPKNAHINRLPVQKPKSNIRNLLNRRR